MNVVEGVRAILGRTGFCLVRPSGTMLVISRLNEVQKIGPRGPYQWHPAFQDLVAEDWSVLSPETIAKMQREAAAGQENS